MAKDPRRLERCQRWNAVFGTAAGQSVLAELRRMTGQDHSSLAVSSVDGKADAYFTVFHEGRRSIWLDIEKCLAEPPDVPEEGAIDEGEGATDTGDD